jgi:hypothetical protein
MSYACQSAGTNRIADKNRQRKIGDCEAPQPTESETENQD